MSDIAQLRRLLEAAESEHYDAVDCQCALCHWLRHVSPALLAVAEKAEALTELNARVRDERQQLQLSGMDVFEATATATGEHGVAVLTARDELAAALAELEAK